MANPVLKKGSKGEAVNGLQNMLYRLGYDPGGCVWPSHRERGQAVPEG